MQRKVLVRALAGCAALGLMFLPAGGARAQQREHCGTITNNETWTPAGNPHLVKCTVIVRNSTLTISAATQVLMAEGTSIVVQSGAALVAVGDPMVGNVRIQANTGEEVSGFWGQIKVEAGAANSILDLAIVRGGGGGGLPMVAVEDALLVVNRSQLRQSAGPALGFWANSLGPALELAGQATTDYECTTNPHPNLVLDRGATIAVTAGAHHVIDSQTWHHFCAPYIVAEDLIVGGADTPVLTLDRGVTLKFGAQNRFIVGDGAERPGQLETSGAPEQPVVLGSLTDQIGSWHGLDLTADAGLSTLITTRIENGGAGGRPMVVVRSLDATALDVTFRRAEGYPLGIVADAVGRFLAGVGHDAAPAFVNNGVQRVLVYTNPDGDDLTGSAEEWGDPSVPYELDGTLTIANGGRPAKLALTAGATLLFDGSEMLEVAKGGALVAKGPPLPTGTDDHIVLSSQTEEPGAWRGLVVRDEADLVQLDLAAVMYGGAGGAPMVEWGDADGTVIRSRFRGASGYPFQIGLSRAPDVIMGTDQLSTGADLRNQFDGNGSDRLLVHVDGPVSASRLREWADPGAPVEFDATVVAASALGPRLVWHDGLDLRFRAGQGFQLATGAGNRGNVEVADEDPDLPVRLGPLDAAQGWAGLQVGAAAFLRGADLALAPPSTPDGASLAVAGGTVELAGLAVVGSGSGTGLDASAGAHVDLVHATFRGLGIGIRTRSGANLSVAESSIEGNASWGIRNEDPTVCQRAIRVWWGKPTGPQDDSDAKDGCMAAKNDSPGADKVSDDVEWWPYALDNVGFTPSSGIGPNAKRIYLPRAARP